MALLYSYCYIVRRYSPIFIAIYTYSILYSYSYIYYSYSYGYIIAISYMAIRYILVVMYTAIWRCYTYILAIAICPSHATGNTRVHSAYMHALSTVDAESSCW